MYVPRGTFFIRHIFVARATRVSKSIHDDSQVRLNIPTSRRYFRRGVYLMSPPFQVFFLLLLNFRESRNILFRERKISQGGERKIEEAREREHERKRKRKTRVSPAADFLLLSFHEENLVSRRDFHHTEISSLRFSSDAS